MKQIVSVRRAVVDGGCRTSAEVASATSLSPAACAAYLSELAKYGRVRVTGAVRLPGV